MGRGLITDGPDQRRGPEAVTVTVIVVTYRSAAVLGDCLASLPAALAGVASHELIVVDNASPDGSAALARRLAPYATLIEMGRNAGYAAAFNAALAAARPASAVLVLNADVRLGERSVHRLLHELSRPGTGIAVPRLLAADGTLEPSLRREPNVLRVLGEAVLGGVRAGRFEALGEMVTSPGAYDAARTADWATGAVMLMSGACLDACARPGGQGPWDESFFLYSEETEFALRARDAGFELRYVPDAHAVHLGGESGTAPDLWSLLVRNRLRLYRRRRGPRRAAAFRAALVLNEVLRAPRSPTHRAALVALLRTEAGAAAHAGPPAVERAGPPDYICFAAQDWWYHNQAHSDFQLMQGVAASRTVLLVNSIGMRMPMPGRSTRFLRRILRKAASVARLLRQPVPGLPRYWVMTPLILPFYGIGWARRANAGLVRAQVRAAARRVGIVDPVVVVTVPTAWEVVRGMPTRALAYNRSDKHSAFGEADRGYIEAMEQALLRSADTVLYVSHALMDAESALTGDRAYFLDHGVDLSHFRRRDSAEEPPDLRAVPHPRVGFFGGLDDYTVDFDLLERLARELPDAQLVLVGDATCALDRFDGLANVHRLGFRPYADIPRYGSGFDVAIMPWLDNEWIRHSNPIKLKEYLALGLPVVSTDFPELRPYADVVRVAGTPADFVALVRRTLDDGGPSTPEGRRAAVAEASWERRARELIDVCERSVRAS